MYVRTASGGQALRYVYADILFLINFLFDFSLLYLAGRFARSAIAGRRLVLAAALGAAYGVASVFPGLVFLMSLPAKILASCLMVALAYPDTARDLRSYVTVLGLFYLCSLVVGGAALAWTYLTSATAGPGTTAVSGRVGLGVVLPAVLFGAILLHWALVWGRERGEVEFLCVVCRVVIAGQGAEFRALVDTGNRLRDPISDSPVVIVEYPAVTRILPPEFAPVWEAEQDEPDLAKLATVLGGSGWSARLRLVPFSSLGRANGLLVGFRPDEVVVGRQGRSVRRTDVVVCVSPRPLSAEGSYRALLPPEVLQGEAAA